MGKGPVPVRATLVLLGIGALWAPALCVRGRPSWRYSSSEVVVPKKEVQRSKNLHIPGKLSYSLRFGGQRHVMHLWRKYLMWPRQVALVTQDDQGALQIDYPYFPEDCYFLGYLEDVPLSMVTVNTCSGGLEGVMMLDDFAYEISPLRESNGFEHVVSHLVADPDAIGPTYSRDHQEVPTLPEGNSSMDPRPPLLLAVVAANQQGRMIGLYYDSSTCICQRRATCVMYRWPGITDTFSNCSFVHVQHIVSNRGFPMCYFRELYEIYNRTHKDFRCGDYEVDQKEEQCDCGTLKECYFNQCCDTKCKFTSGSTCDRGQCCTNCTFSASGTLCRTVLNVCDLPEFCTGGNNRCPEDTYLQDGTPCSEESYCFFGNCTDRSMHCKEIFGGDAENAEEACYNINFARFRFGHCSREAHRLVYKGCEGGDKMCGRLQCRNVTRLPLLQDHVSFHHSLIDGSNCFGLDEHRATRSVDVGHVRQGTPCSSDKMCMNRQCSAPLTSLGYDCVPERCNFKGVCNNRGSCHCHAGWRPPTCDRQGNGGSLESGPHPSQFREVGRNPEMIIYLRLLYGRIYLLVVALLFAYAINLKTIKTVKVEAEAAS
ncbi:disintegrin and metalloproteinase domain-containing protein 21-like [Sciurus carolinensis]|uniref:disintegrin and metalloproteinase domain-containing protein 21-like n=1 Tax=Sciurus carolinensis TaxID=30640 RepID=UPI001FB27493|nr:disintegrin and metalloproteinase domain-containing protein 21-like [Sciurus carolinensis]